MLTAVRARGERSACGSSRAPCPGSGNGTQLRRAVAVIARDECSTAGDTTPTGAARSQARLHSTAAISSTVLIDLVPGRHQYTLLAPSLPAGFFYQPEFVTPAEERLLIAEIERLEF